MDKVNKLIELGVPIPAAIQQAIGGTLAEFADRHGMPRTTASELVNGARRPSEKQIAALIAELGGTEAEWRELLWQAGKPISPSAA